MFARHSFEGPTQPELQVGEPVSVIVGHHYRGYRVEHTVITKITKTTVRTQDSNVFSLNTLKEWGTGKQDPWTRSGGVELVSRAYGEHMAVIFERRAKLERARNKFAKGLSNIHNTYFPSQGDQDTMRGTLEQVKAQVEQMEAALASIS